MGCLSLWAQMGLHVGIMGGPQYTKMINNQPLDPATTGFAYVTSFGYSGMIKIGYNFVPPIGLHAAAIYSVQTQDYTTLDDNGLKTTTSRSATYVKVPILLHLSSDPGPVMGVFEIGPQFGILRDASLTVAGVAPNLPYPVTSLWKPNDFAVAWGLGVEFGITPGFHFCLQHRGDYGLFDFEAKQVSANGVRFYSSERKKANNLTLGIVGGFNFIITGGHSKTTRHFKGKTWRNNWR